jgi:hypothetical protein
MFLYFLGFYSLVAVNVCNARACVCVQAIAKVCECWWIDERPGAELLMPQLLMYLLVQALGDESRDTDLKRLFAVFFLI